MTTNEIIESLKANKWMAYGGLSEEQQDCLEAHWEDVEELRLPGHWACGKMPDPVNSTIYRLVPDFQPVRWFLDMDRGTLLSSNHNGMVERLHSGGLFSMETMEIMIGRDYFIELQEGEVDYWRNKPKGDWEIRKADAGETYWSIQGDCTVAYSQLKAYRWVKRKPVAYRCPSCGHKLTVEVK